MDLTSGILTGRASVISRKVGTFVLDCTVTEEHESTLRITKNPVESGAQIADHAILEPKVITVSGIAVAYERPRNIERVTGFNLDKLDNYPLPIEIVAVARQQAARVEQYYSLFNVVKDRATRAIAPWVESPTGNGNDESETLDRLGRVFDELLTIQKSGETIDVQTGIKMYKNMLLTNIKATQENTGAIELTLTLEEIFIVESKIGQGLHPDLKNQPKKQNKGRVNLKMEEDTSLLKKITNQL